MTDQDLYYVIDELRTNWDKDVGLIAKLQDEIKTLQAALGECLGVFSVLCVKSDLSYTSQRVCSEQVANIKNVFKTLNKGIL